jgi:hypothetical protein
MTTINRATWVDDDGSGATGTIINNARLQGDIYDKIDQGFATLDAKDASQDTSITANGPHKILSTNHTDSVAATLVAGDVLRADATGKLARLPAGSNGQLLSVVSGLPAWIAAPAAPGLWTDVAFNAANFSTPTAGATWAVTAGSYSYTVVGNTAIVAVTVLGTASTITGAPVRLRITLPAGITPVGTWGVPFNYNVPGVPAGVGLCSSVGTQLDLIRDVIGTTFPAGGIYIYVTATFRISGT